MNESAGSERVAGENQVGELLVAAGRDRAVGAWSWAGGSKHPRAGPIALKRRAEFWS